MAGRVGVSSSVQSGASGIELASSARLSAAGAGDVLQTARREVRALVRRAKGDRFEAMKLGLTRLVEDSIITERDRDRLQMLVDALRAAGDKPIETDEVPEKIRATYHAIVADSRSSGVAVAIASLVNSLVIPSEPMEVGGTVAFAIISVGERGGRAITGAIIGAIVGGALGGPGGAINGAIIGGTLGAKSAKSK